MKYKISQLLVPMLVGLSMCTFSCRDVFEKNIEKDRVALVAPANGTLSQAFTIVFWWDELDGADEYQLQVASPDFVQPNMLVLDTTVTRNTFAYTLGSGSYNWRVKGLNSAYETDWTTFALVVDSTDDISASFVNLLNPADGLATSNLSVHFDWQLLENADDYELRWQDQNGTVGTETTDKDSITVTLPEGIYSWSVAGRNASYVSQRNFRNLYVDATAPDAPTLTAPADGDSLLSNQNIAFSWTRHETVTYAPLSDVLYIYSDTTAFTIFKSVTLTSQSYTQDSLATGEWFWAVQTSDAAGNTGDFSFLRSLKVP